MRRCNYYDSAPSASSQIITLERLLEEAEERITELAVQVGRLRGDNVELDDQNTKLLYRNNQLEAALGE